MDPPNYAMILIFINVIGWVRVSANRSGNIGTMDLYI